MDEKSGRCESLLMLGSRGEDAKDSGANRFLDIRCLWL